MSQTAITKTEIQQASIGRVTDKITHEHYYVVKSDTQENVWYTVRWNNAACEWQCNCPSYKPCKHERAVQEVLKIRRQHIALAMGGQTPKIVAKMQEQEDKKLAERGHLNGNREAVASTKSGWENIPMR
jgi:hypothetical protein